MNFTSIGTTSQSEQQKSLIGSGVLKIDRKR